jgi:hypothetical protein
LIQSLKEELVAVQALGRTALFLRSGTGMSDGIIRNNVKLIPQYDSYILGSGPPDRIVLANAKDLIVAYKGGRYEGAAGVPVLLIAGVFAGTWRRELKGKRLAIAVQSLEKLTVAQREIIKDEAERIASFLEARLEL